MNIALRLCVLLLVASGVSAFRIDRRTKHRSTQNELTETKLNAKAVALAQEASHVRLDGDKLTKIVTTLVGIATTMVTAFGEDPPDVNYAIKAIETQGWKLIEIVVPEEHQSSASFGKAKRAWKAILADVADNSPDLLDTWSKGDVKGIVDKVLTTVNSALNAVAEALPEDKDLILAIRQLVQAMSDHVMEFVTDMGLFDAGASFMQIAKASTGPAQITELLTRGLGIFTSLVLALSEDSPDLEHAFLSMSVEGWQMIKLVVPEPRAQVHEAWNRAFAEAPLLTEKIMDAWKKGDLATVIKTVLATVETALQAAAEGAEDGDAKILNGVATLVVALGNDWIQFCDAIGWSLTHVEVPTIDADKLTRVVTAAVGIASSIVTAFVTSPPDLEYAFNSISIKGWKIIELLVPADQHSSPEFNKAERAWKAVLAGVAKNFDKLLDASKKGDAKGIVEEVLRNVNSALTTVAQALPEDAELILAVRDLVQGMSDSVLEFTTTMGWLDGSGSLVQLAQKDSLTSAMDGQSLTQLLTTGVGLFTTCVAAFSEDPPDLDYAFGSFRIQGWKMVKTLVPDVSRSARTEWNNFFYDAPERVEPIMQAWNAGDISTVVKSTISALDAALTASARAAPENAELLNGVAKLVVSLGDEWLRFASRVGWLA